MTHDQITLDDLLVRDVAVQWFEGVALVQALCRQLSARSGADGIFPAASQITLASDGTVTIERPAATNPVPAAGHLLARMLSDDVPVRLRLLITQATAEAATIASLHELSESLAYFERPNPEAILSALHARASVAPPRRQDTETAGPVVVERAPRAYSLEIGARTRRAIVLAAAILLLAVAGVLVHAGLQNGSVASVVERLESAITKAAEVTTATSKNDEMGGAAAAQAIDAGAATDKAPRRPASDKVPARAITLPPALGPPDMVAKLAIADVSAAGAPPVIAAESWEPEDKIYSGSDASVTPPRQVYPALPALPSPDRRPEDLTVLDLVIGADGHVEKVQLRTTPRDVHEFMLVSAAKAWRFEPAALNGRPVRFRHSVAITSRD